MEKQQHQNNEYIIIKWRKEDEEMTVELTTQLIQLINTLPQTTQVLIYMAIYTLVPLFIIALVVINNRIEIENFKKQRREEIEQNASIW